MSKYKKKVLILGAGSAGVGAARELKKASAGAPELEVTLVDQQNYHLVLPLIYQVVTGSVAPGHISFPVRILLSQGGIAGRVKFRQSRVQGIDVERKIVATDDGELEWDYLVVALGSTTNFFGMDEVEKNALTFRSLRDGINIHNHILDNYEAALLEGNEQPRRELLTCVVVGGGPTGVELAASIQEFASKVLIRDYPSLTPYVRVILVESQDTVLSGLNAKVGELAITRLRSQGVDVLLRTRISKAWADGVETADGQVIPTRTVIWVAGVKPAAVVESLPLDKARDGRILVSQNLEVPEAPGLYVIGDCAYLPQENVSEPYPATHQVAMRQGPACARNILHAMREERQRPFRYKFKGQIIYISRNVAVAQILGRAFDGFAAGMLRRILYLEQMLSYLGLLTGFQSKLSTCLDWFFAYFYHRDTSRL